MREMLICFQNLYDTNSGKLAAWFSASHTGKDPKAKAAASVSAFPSVNSA
jgi:hypothetical protein